MDDKNDFALVTRPSGTVEKVAPGTKRVLSGMVADTLALAKKAPLHRVVVVSGNNSMLRAVEAMVRYWSKDVTVLQFEFPVLAWHELSRTDPDLLITASAMFGLSGKEIVQRLLDRKATYPIVVMSPYEPDELWVREFASRGLNVSYLLMPFLLEDLQKLLDAGLKISRNKF